VDVDILYLTSSHFHVLVGFRVDLSIILPNFKAHKGLQPTDTCSLHELN